MQCECGKRGQSPTARAQPQMRIPCRDERGRAGCLSGSTNNDAVSVGRVGLEQRLGSLRNVNTRQQRHTKARDDKGGGEELRHVRVPSASRGVPQARRQNSGVATWQRGADEKQVNSGARWLVIRTLSLRRDCSPRMPALRGGWGWEPRRR